MHKHCISNQKLYPESPRIHKAPCKILPRCSRCTDPLPVQARPSLLHSEDGEECPNIWVLSSTMAHCDQNNPHSGRIVPIQLVWLVGQCSDSLLSPGGSRFINKGWNKGQITLLKKRETWKKWSWWQMNAWNRSDLFLLSFKDHTQSKTQKWHICNNGNKTNSFIFTVTHCKKQNQKELTNGWEVKRLQETKTSPVTKLALRKTLN